MDDTTLGNMDPFFELEGIKLLNVPKARSVALEVVQQDRYQVVGLLDESWSVLDLGSFYGEFSLLAHKLGCHKILGVEATLESYLVSRMNQFRQTGKFSGMFRLGAAVLEDTGQMVAHHVWNHHPAGSGPPHENSTLFMVSAVSVLELVKEFQGERLFVKIDIEGAEKGLFQNTEWLEGVQALSMETHDYDADVFGQILQKAGFQVKLLEDDYPPVEWDKKSMPRGLVIARR